MEERPDVNTMPIDASIKDAYERFNATAPDYAQEDMEVARQGLYPLFGDTYFYDYYLMSELPEY
jgi:hypothetical protein